MYLEKPQGVLVVRHQNILGVTVMTQHHLVILTTNAGFLIAAKRSPCRVGVVTVAPDATRLDTAGKSLHLVYVTGPDTGAQSIERVIGNFHGFGFVLKRGHTQNRSKYFLLENPASCYGL